MNLRFLTLATVLTFSLLPSVASAYCRTNTCDPNNPKDQCTEEAGNPGCTSGGASLFWPGQCIGVALQQDASKQVSFAEFERVVRASFDQWNQVSCNGQAPSIHVDILGSTPCNAREFNDGYGNANLLLFRDDTWPYEGQSSVLALTTLTFGIESGSIYDADMEINAVPSRVTLTTGETGVKIDLQSIVTHEAGHLLGLAHSLVPTASMTPIYVPGDLSFRILDPDDQAGLCAAYPPDRSGLPACDPTGPTERSGGYSTECGGTDKQAPAFAPSAEDDGCGCAVVGRPSPRRPGAWWPADGSPAGVGWLFGALAMLAAARRRAARSDRATC